jgi:hypothetical protein
MLYRNPYNKGIVSTLDSINRRYVNHLSDESTELLGSGVHNNASKCECMCDPCQCERGLEGGSGFASGTFMDTGEDRVIGAGVGSATYRKRGRGQIGSMPPPQNLNEYPQNFVGGGMERPVGGRKHGRGLKELTDDLKKFDLNRIKDYVGLAKPKRGCGVKEIKDDLKKADFNRVKDYIGLAKPKRGGAMLNQTQLARVPKVERVVEKSQMQGNVGGMSGAGMSGGADARAKRAGIVKRVMAEKGLKMIDASKYVKAHGLYKK